MEKIKVLYIAGAGRSGTTLLEMLLGQVEGLFSAGELRGIWNRGFKKNQLCGCGNPFLKCELWQAVTKAAFPKPQEIYEGADDIIAIKDSLDRLRYSPGLKYRKNLNVFCKQYLYPLYSSISKVTGKKIIIDSSKSPSYLYILAKCGFIDLYVLHMVRDSRGVAYSWSKNKLRPEIVTGKVHMPRSSSLKSSRHWIINNVIPLLIRKSVGRNRYIRLRYEDLVREPQRTLQCALGFLNIRDEMSFFVNKTEARLKQTHTVSGNPVRFSTGNVSLRLDDDWQKNMSSKEKLIVSLLTYPFLRKFYPDYKLYF